MRTFTQSPNERTDYTVDWSQRLQSGETISDYTVTVDGGITKVSDASDNSHVVVWLTGGQLGTDYQVTVQVTTSQDRVYESGLIVHVSDAL